MPTPFQNFGTGDVIYASQVSEMQASIKNLERAAAFYGGLSSGASNAYVVNIGPGPDSPYQSGMIVNFKAHVTNTAGSPDVTLSVNGGTAKPILRGSSSLSAGTLVVGQVYSVIYDSSGSGQFHLLMSGGFSLDDLTDVAVAGPTTGQLIQYGASSFGNASSSGFQLLGSISGKLVHKRSLNNASGTVYMGSPPSGKRWLILSAFVTRGPGSGSVTFTPGFYAGGTFVGLQSSVLLGSSDQPYSASTYPVLENSDQLAHSSSAAGLNVFYEILEFSASLGLKSARLSPIYSGYNTLYLCPTGKSAQIVAFQGLGPSSDLKFKAGTLNYYNGSGTSTGIFHNLVRPGESASTPGVGSNALVPYSSWGYAGFVSTLQVNTCMEAGDALVLNSSATVTPSMAWITVQEFD